MQSSAISNYTQLHSIQQLPNKRNFSIHTVLLQWLTFESLHPLHSCPLFLHFRHVFLTCFFQFCIAPAIIHSRDYLWYASLQLIPGTLLSAQLSCFDILAKKIPCLISYLSLRNSSPSFLSPKQILQSKQSYQHMLLLQNFSCSPTPAESSPNSLMQFPRCFIIYSLLSQQFYFPIIC